ncbi:MAG: starch-binding protein, partial [Muribaculaceae bacterium]|nr:starch-binding protein [Muribaculaceae bacterium]
FYNDASWNVVYVDSHDYSPGPNDGIRFAGGTAQWAENLSLMFTFRGIPCLYYGSEVEFQKGKTIDEGPALASMNSGRAYFGEYLKGSVTATDFGKYTDAKGNMAKTLNGDLAQHIRRLNLIRAAVPALRKGQYTWDGCSAKGGWAFKRAYKDSYALVAINGGATFTNVPAGTYTDLVTGQTYQGGGSITVNAPTNQGQLRVLVKDWTGGKVGEDGKFIYATSPVAHGGSVSFTDPGTTEYYTKEDAPGPSVASVSFSPNGGSFKTETQNVTVTLSDASVSGWYQVAGQSRVNLSPSNRTSTFTIGENMNYGETVTVSWGAVNEEGKENNGSVTYKKVDPNASITVYVKAPNGGNIYAWSGENKIYGAWPGKAINTGEAVVVGDDTFYSFTMDGYESVNVIFNNNDQQTGDITGIDSDVYYEYDGAATAKKLDNVVTVPQARVVFSPNGGAFSEDQITVTATALNAVSSWYKVGDGAQQNFSGSTSFVIGQGMDYGDNVTVSWGATNSEGTAKSGSVTFTKKLSGGSDDPEGNFVVYYDNSQTNWGKVMVHYFGGTESSNWPGVEMTKHDCGHYYYNLPEGTTGVVFNNGNGDQTNDVNNPKHNGLYTGTGNRGFNTGTHSCTSGVTTVFDNENAPAELYNLQGVRVTNPGPGVYIMVKGKKTKKIHIR